MHSFSLFRSWCNASKQNPVSNADIPMRKVPPSLPRGCPRFPQLHALRDSRSLHATKIGKTGVFMLGPSHWQKIRGGKARWLKLSPFQPLLRPKLRAVLTEPSPISTPTLTSSHHQNHTVTSPSSPLCVQIPSYEDTYLQIKVDSSYPMESVYFISNN